LAAGIMKIAFRINGRPATCETVPGTTLLTALRRDLGLTGTKDGCSTGECGACTVIVDGEPVASCLMLAAQAEGRSVVTIEGLAAADGSLHPVQQGFLEEGGVQCGFCTPGMIMAAAALLERNTDPTVSEIQDGISGNLCRCTGYSKIVRSIQTAARIKRDHERTGAGPAARR
jgi:carbon-monoxide dehydrogenase small subunit